MKKLLVLLLLSNLAYADTDHTKPPVGVAANVTKEQLCVDGYTKTVRPPVSYTDKLKLEWTPAGHKPSEYELDHYIPIELGGAPRDPNNLWMQVLADARKKDVQETALHRDLCKGKITLDQAQSNVVKWAK